jgi:hypothetical protein
VAGMLGIGLAGTASADPWDRDRDAGSRVSRMQELRERIEARSVINRPNLERTITGRELGRETVQRGDVYREFRDRNDMMGALNTKTQIRGSATAASTADEGGTGRQFSNAGRTTSDPVEFAAKARPAREREFQTRQEMVSQLNTQTTMRASRTAAATGGDSEQPGSAFPNAGRGTTDPRTLTDDQRQALGAAGFRMAGAGQEKSTDLEDKAK